MLSLIDLPPELLLQIFGKIAVQDILSVRQTCHFLYNATHERSVWFDALYTLAVQQHLPLPGLHSRQIINLDSSELERLARRASRYHQNWTSPSPTCTRRTEIDSIEISPHAGVRILAIHFLPGKGGRYLLSSSFLESSLEPRSISMDCWDVDGDVPKRVATISFSSFASIVVNQDPEHPGAVAVTRRSTNNVQAEGEPITSVYSINLESEDPESVFSLISEFPSARYPIIMHGSRFLSANHITNTTQVIDTESGDLICVLCTPLVNNDPTLSGFEDFRCLDAVVWQQFVLIFRQNWIHLYKIPNRSQASTLHSNSPDHPPEIRPVATHKWPWRIDSLEVSTHDSFVSRHARFMSQPLPPNQPPMINILLRFDSWYPWPVNTLHHYTLSPCSSYHRSSAILPYLAADSIPFMETSITSHMRLFTPSDLTIGQYGTALWIDAQSDLTSSSQAGDLGQRLAGKVLRSERDPSWDSDRPLLKPGLPGVLLLTNELEENMGTSGSLVPVMVFGVWETHSEWSKVAVEEGEGRIALGSVEGRICVMDYVPRGMEL